MTGYRLPFPDLRLGHHGPSLCRITSLIGMVPLSLLLSLESSCAAASHPSTPRMWGFRVDSPAFSAFTTHMHRLTVTLPRSQTAA